MDRQTEIDSIAEALLKSSNNPSQHESYTKRVTGKLDEYESLCDQIEELLDEAESITGNQVGDKSKNAKLTVDAVENVTTKLSEIRAITAFLATGGNPEYRARVAGYTERCERLRQPSRSRSGCAGITFLIAAGLSTALIMFTK